MSLCMIIEVVIWIVFNSVPPSYFADLRIITVRIQLADRSPQALIKIYHALFPERPNTTLCRFLPGRLLLERVSIYPIHIE